MAVSARSERSSIPFQVRGVCMGESPRHGTLLLKKHNPFARANLSSRKILSVHLHIGSFRWLAAVRSDRRARLSISTRPTTLEAFMASAHDVARYIVRQLAPLSTIKLQKLVYYSQAWHLVWEDAPLFDERVEAGKMAPWSRRYTASIAANSGDRLGTRARSKLDREGAQHD